MNNELYAKIEDYLDNNLSDMERQAFESDLRADPALASAFNTVKEARGRLGKLWSEEDADTALQRTLQQLGRKHFSASTQQSEKKSSAKIVRMPRAILAIAAAIALLIVGWLFLRPPGQEQLYSQYREFPEADFTLRGAPTIEGALQQGADAFNQKDYQAALQSFQVALRLKPEELEIRFFIGLCQLELKQYAAAVTSFQQISTTQNAWAGEAQWYLALSYLRQNQREACADALKQIGENSAHYSEAQQLLDNL